MRSSERSTPRSRQYFYARRRMWQWSSGHGKGSVRRAGRGIGISVPDLTEESKFGRFHASGADPLVPGAQVD